MKVVNTRGIKEKILLYLEKQQIERYIAETITGPISSEGLQYSDEMKLEELANKFLEHASDWGEAYTYDEAMITTILMTLVKEHPPINHEEMVPVYESIVFMEMIFRKIRIWTASGSVVKAPETTHTPISRLKEMNYLSMILRWIWGMASGYRK